jgi:hypothetical protein
MNLLPRIYRGDGSRRQGSPCSLAPTSRGKHGGTLNETRRLQASIPMAGVACPGPDVVRRGQAVPVWTATRAMIRSASGDGS